jgi:hypothetical protein
LPASLERILRAGWTRGESDALLLRAFARRSPGATIAALGDVIGLEAYVNHVHLDDYLDPATTRDATLRHAFSYAARGLQSAWRNHRVACTAVVSSGDRATGVIVRFHSAGSGPAWLVDDLEAYASEGIASIGLA